MNAFYTTVQIVAGILLPLALCGLIYLLIGVFSYLKAVFEHYANEMQKKPPYDQIESSASISDNALHIQLIRKQKVVFEDEIPMAELRDL